MPRYTLVIARRFRQDLRRLDAQMHRRVLEMLERLQEDPFQGIRSKDSIGRAQPYESGPEQDAHG